MKSSIKRKFGFVVVILMIGWFCFQIYRINVDYYSEHILHKEKMILTYSQIARSLADQGEIDRIPESLKTAIHLRQFDWYLIQVDGKTVQAYPEEATHFPIYNVENEYIEPEVSAKTVQLQPGVFLTIGVSKHKWSYLKNSVSRFLASNIQTLVVSLIIVFAAFLYYIRDIIHLVHFLKLNREERLLKIQKSLTTRTFEGGVLKNAIDALESSQNQILEERYLLAKQVLPSLRAEIFSGKKPPYDFHCVLVRLDINGYSKRFMSDDRSKFLLDLNDYFMRLSEIVSRYQGFVHEFIGDEVLFYFKYEDVPSKAWLQAVAACRDIEAMTNQSAPWTFKAVIAQGDLHFGPMVHGYSLSGDVLIRTVRILNSVELEKNLTTILLAPQLEHRSQTSQDGHLGHHLELVQMITNQNEVSIRDHRDLDLSQKCFKIKSWVNLELILDTDCNFASLVPGFLSTDDLGIWYKYLIKMISDKQDLQVQNLIKELQKNSPLLSTIDAVEFTARFLNQILTMSISPRLKSSLLQMTKHILSANIATDRNKLDRLQVTLLQYLDGLDHRLVADAIEVIRHFIPRSKHIFENMLAHMNSRVVANVCIALNVDEVHQSSLRFVISGIQNGNRSFFYAGQTILEHWKNKDSVIYSSEDQLLILQSLEPAKRFKAG